MSDLTAVVVFSLVGGIVSLAGGLVLLSNKTLAERALKYITPFAAGALLAAAFTDVLPEAAHDGDVELALRWTLAGILFFFLLERFLRWFHHHHPHDGHHTHKNEEKGATIPLIIIGDLIHNFLDGIAIAAAFLIDVPTGIVTTIAVAAHEIPQEIGDFGLLLDKGMKRANVIKVNILSALTTTLAAVLFFVAGKEFDLTLEIAFGLVAGFFIYIAVSDIIPSIHKNEEQKLAGSQTVMLIVGVIVVALTANVLHGYIEIETEHEEAGQVDRLEEQ